MEHVKIESVVASTGWVDVSESPVFSSDAKSCFVRLPHLESDLDGAFKHIAMISTDVSSSSRRLEEVLDNAALFP